MRNGDIHLYTTDKISKKLLRFIWDDNQWLRLPKALVKALREREAVMLAFLLNHDTVVMAKKRQEGWFYCKMSIMKKEMGYSNVVQSRIVRKLKDLGLIETEMKERNIKGKTEWIRHIRINYEKVWQMIQPHLPDRYKED